MLRYEVMKVFVSSTFLDLEKERDALSKKYKELNKKIQKRQIAVDFCNLRW